MTITFNTACVFKTLQHWLETLVPHVKRHCQLLHFSELHHSSRFDIAPPHTHTKACGTKTECMHTFHSVRPWGFLEIVYIVRVLWASLEWIVVTLVKFEPAAGHCMSVAATKSIFLLTHLQSPLQSSNSQSTQMVEMEYMLQLITPFM